MGFGADGGGSDVGAVTTSGSGYESLRASLTESTTDAAVAAAAPTAGCRVLVSTESSARGLDLAAVDCVMLYALPQAADQYLHLAGRTGRQGRDGAVVSLLAPHETGPLGTITRQLGISVKQNPQIALALADARARQ